MANIDNLIKKRSALKAKLTNFNNYLSVIQDMKSLSSLQRNELEGRYKKFDAIYDTFDELQLDIEVHSDEPEEAYAERAKFEERFHSLAAQARALLSPVADDRDDESVASSTSQSGGSKNFVRLPKIDLPTFCGGLESWLEYKDTFLSLIHNSSCIDDISKFHYLRASLKGNAQQVIANIDFKATNYDTAWNLLCQRYDNNRLLISNHLQALFNANALVKESSAALRGLIDVINKNTRALKTLHEPVQYWDTMIIYMMSNKLDSTTNREWEEYRSSIEKSPTMSQFCTFINNKADLLKTLEDKLNNQTKTNNYKTYSFSKENKNQQPSETNKLEQCPMCSKSHLLYSCDLFRSLPVTTRLAKAKEFGVCLNCLRSTNHTANRCKLTHCKYCKFKHNTLLHVNQSKNTTDPMPSVALPVDVSINAPISNNTSENFALLQQLPTSSNLLLSTALVKVVNEKGERFEARILLDNGTAFNYTSYEYCDKLGLTKSHTNSTVSGINNQLTPCSHTCNLTIESNTSSFKANITCNILPQLTQKQPPLHVDISKIPFPSDLQYADPFFYEPSDIDILVGSEIFWTVLGNATIKLGKNNPEIRDTKLGWLVTRPILSCMSQSRAPVQSHTCYHTMTQIDSTVSKFWELDSIPSQYTLSQEERACEESFAQNTYRDDNGQFVVTMPLKQDPNLLGNSYDIAKARFLSLERRFQRDSNFKKRYVDFMHEYESLSHMTENVGTNKPHAGDTPEYFLPHHGVIKETRTTTKFRTVFDGSMTSSSGKSLNDLQMVGPTVQNDLLSILLRFRQHKYIVSADVEKMYRAVLINPSQRQLQQIVFRDELNLPLKTYSLNTVTYGTASAPYLATKCLVTLADSASDDRVKKSIQNDFYVDDYLSGCDSISDTIDLANSVASILATAKFFLRKWQSNNSHVLSQIPGASEQSQTLGIAERQNIASKTLGLQWLCELDVLGFSINIECNKKVTKRHILSVISQIFDPLGLVGPCIVEAKIIMQQLWISNCDWDAEVPKQLCADWVSFANTLPYLNNLKIPRRVFVDSTMHELHIFTDASERAYGAAIYARSIDDKGEYRVHLLTSKSRIAPIKNMTIPRLELSGALLGSRLYTKVQSSLTLPNIKCYFWSDSTIVLCWLRTKSNLLKPFVRNRVSEIQDTTAGHTWGYVDTKQNPADIITRGLKADLISGCTLWWSGPTFLTQNESYWPKMPNDIKQDLSEIVVHTQAQVSYHTQVNNNLIADLIHKHSNIYRLQRILAYLYRFINNCNYQTKKQQGHLQPFELTKSLKLIIKHAQLEMFPNEHHLLASQKSLPRKNRLVALSPFINDDGVIRVGGRLDNAPYDYNVKHPILLCSKHHFTKCLFQTEHVKLLHAGPQLLLANIRQTYWPLGGRNLSKTTVKQCVKCFRYKCQTVQPIMGQLPSTRTVLEFPFLHCNVDYAGPILLADRKGRGCKLTKAYICIFICQAVKCVHIELVTELTKEAYMAAINRFVSRRGKPISILSDNATTFVGTCNELQRFIQESDISYDIAQKGIEFSFVPPYTPHFNGLAEAAVRSTKHHLKRLLQTTHFTYEEMSTCLAQIEAILNSRPLTPMSSDPLDLTALTPAHLLIGRSLMSVPHPHIDDVNISSIRQRFERVEHIRQHFWNRFHIEYVSLLQSKTKWSQSTPQQLSIGSLVLVKDKGQPPLLWPLGRITKVMPGGDGATRVAEVKTSRGSILRAFNNICPLPL